MKMILILYYYQTLARHIKFEKIQALKKELSEELMPIAWHTNRRWDFWV